jgi:peptidoglycan/xylan/chitin deacetylase (PgdA/CDA1 family)
MGAVFTFSSDDGHPSDMKVADLLGKHNLRGTFYVPVRNREGLPTMSENELRGVGRDFEIGSHTFDHRYLRSVGKVEAYRQINEGKTRLEQMLGRAVAGFCYPGGKYRRSDLALVQGAGFTYARTTTNLCFDAGHSRFELPTTIQFYPHPRAVYWRNFAHAGRWATRLAGLRLAVEHENWIERMYALFDYACQHDGTFHMWAHAYEIDRLDAWSELDRFFAHVSEQVAASNRLTNQQVASRRFCA